MAEVLGVSAGGTGLRSPRRGAVLVGDGTLSLREVVAGGEGQVLLVEGGEFVAGSFRLEGVTADPAAPVVGQMWLRVDL